jgi:hypothetical protein
MNDEATSVALLPDGKIVVGTTGGVLVYSADGTPVGGGYATSLVTPVYVPTGTTSVASFGRVKDVAPAPGGAFYALGEAGSHYLARRAGDGRIDQPFGTTVDNTIPNGGVQVSGGTNDVTAIVSTPDGHVLVAGQGSYEPPARPGRAPRTVYGMTLARYDARGTFDASFGNGRGPAGTFLPVKGLVGGAFSVAVQPDGKVLAAGTALRSARVVRERSGAHTVLLRSAAVWVARFNADGTEDRSFGRNGSTSAPCWSPTPPAT